MWENKSTLRYLRKLPAHIAWVQELKIRMILSGVRNAKVKVEKWRELMLVEDITIWLVKLVQDAMVKGKLLVGSVAHVVGVKLCLELKISLY